MRKIAPLFLALLTLGSSCARPQDGQQKPSIAATSPATSSPAARLAAAIWPTTQSVAFAQVSAAWVDPPTYTLDQMAKRWAYFQHKPFEQSGFNHLTLPFRYEDPDYVGDDSEALAFSFLLSNALDWTPGCYCTRHAYFVCKRSTKQMQSLAKDYSPDRIAPLMRQWGATVAVGGVLRKTAVGYTGQLEVYNKEGTLLLKKEYAQGRGYFDLLGDMAADFMRFRKYEPSEKLLVELRRVRCKDPESLVLLGHAAFYQERNDDEFGLYEEILRRDPDFAEVRYWLSNQRQWLNGNRKVYAQQVRLAAQSYLTEAILDAVGDTAKDAPEPNQMDLLARYVAQAAEMLGPDHPVIQTMGAWTAKDEASPAVEKLNRLRGIAAQYPNSYGLLQQLASDYSFSGDDSALADRAMTASLAVAALQDLNTPGNGCKAYVTGLLAVAVHRLGYGEMAVSAVQWNLKYDLRYASTNTRWNLACEARALADLGHFDRAINLYRYLYKSFPEGKPSRAYFLAEAAISAAISQHWDVVNQIQRDHAPELESEKMQVILDGYGQIALGEGDPKEFAEFLKDKRWAWRDDFVCMMAELEARRGTSIARKDLEEVLRYGTDYRPCWIALDQYDRRDPHKDAAAFYETLGWLHGGDPWVVRAVADFHSRSPGARSLTAVEVLRALQPFQPALYAPPDAALTETAQSIYLSLPLWSAEAGVRQFLAAHQYDRAEELALRYNNLAMNVRKGFGPRARSAYLVLLVRQAREKAQKAIPKPEGDSQRDPTEAARPSSAPLGELR